MVLEKPSSLLIEQDGLICFEERPLDYWLRQSVPLQCLTIEPHQHFELCERCLPKVLVLPCQLLGGFGEILHRLLVDRTWLHLIPGTHRGQPFHFLVALARPKTCSCATKICSLKPMAAEAQSPMGFGGDAYGLLNARSLSRR